MRLKKKVLDNLYEDSDLASTADYRYQSLQPYIKLLQNLNM